MVLKRLPLKSRISRRLVRSPIAQPLASEITSNRKSTSSTQTEPLRSTQTRRRALIDKSRQTRRRVLVSLDTKPARNSRTKAKLVAASAAQCAQRDERASGARGSATSIEFRCSLTAIGCPEQPQASDAIIRAGRTMPLLSKRRLHRTDLYPFAMDRLRESMLPGRRLGSRPTARAVHREKPDPEDQ